MKTIWKYELKVTDRQVVDVPCDAAILAVQVQRGVLCLWAIVDSGTGNPFPKGDFDHLGTVQFGYSVWHVFEEFPS